MGGRWRSTGALHPEQRGYAVPMNNRIPRSSVETQPADSFFWRFRKCARHGGSNGGALHCGVVQDARRRTTSSKITPSGFRKRRVALGEKHNVLTTRSA